MSRSCTPVPCLQGSTVKSTVSAPERHQHRLWEGFGVAVSPCTATYRSTPHTLISYSSPPPSVALGLRLCTREPLMQNAGSCPCALQAFVHRPRKRSHQPSGRRCIARVDPPAFHLHRGPEWPHRSLRCPHHRLAQSPYLLCGRTPTTCLLLSPIDATDAGGALLIAI